MRCTLTLVSIGFFLACARPAPQVGTPDGVPRSPVPPPEVGVDNCVESKELKAFVRALEERRVAARDSALAALGARREVRRGIFAEPASRPLGEVFEQGGQRFAVVAHYTADSEPTVALALQGNAVRRLEERPRAHGVPIRACGVTPCRGADGSAPRRAVLPVAVAFGPEEALGEVWVVTYDYWWAQVSHARRDPCPSPPT